MKTAKVFLCLFAGLVCRNAQAQKNGFGNYIVLKADGWTFEKVIEEFESIIGFAIQYDPQIVPLNKKFHLNYKNVKGKYALADFLNRNGLTYSQVGRQLVLKKRMEAVSGNSYVFSGRVVQKQSGEFLGGAEILLSTSPTAQYTTDAGFFSTQLKPDTNIIVVSYPGFIPITDTVIGDRNYFSVYELELVTSWIPEVVIQVLHESGLHTVNNGQTDQHKVRKSHSRKLPHLLGEPDIIRIMSLYPGVVGGSEGMLGMYVRGGASDQNLVLLDDVPVFNSSHLYGIFSVFNDDAIKSAGLLKGSFPAKYGGRLSSVVNVDTKEGNEYRVKGSASVGLLSSKIFLEGPLIKNRTTFTFAYRRSYLDFLARPVSRYFLFNDSLQNNVYYFWDLNARLTHRFSYRSRLSVSFYNGRDVGGISEKNSTLNSELDIDEKRQQLSSWGNRLVSAKWNYYPGKKTGITIKAHLSEYDYSFTQTYKLNKDYKDPSLRDIQDETSYKLQNGIRDQEVGIVIDHKVNNKLKFVGGGGVALHNFIPGNRTLTTLFNGSTTELFYHDPTLRTPEYYGFGELNTVVKQKIHVDLGLRLSSYRVEKQYYFVLPEPRILLRYKHGKHHWFKASAMRTRQFFHLLTNLTLGLPSDLWVPSVVNFKPSQADQISLGYSYTKNSWNFSSEVFYKRLNHLLEYKDNAGYVTSAVNWEDAVTSGSGEAYGWELMTEKSIGRITGWVSYSLMWNWRKFQDLNEGRQFPSRYDRRHNLYVAGVYKINDNVDFSMSWTYNSGFAFTTPIGKFLSPTPHDPYREILLFGDRNNIRSRDNHRLDIAFNFERKKTSVKKIPAYTRLWSVGLFNLYNRRNPFYVNMGYGKSGNRVLYQVSLLPILPNISYKITF